MTRTENKQQKLRANIMYRTKTDHNDQAREKHNEQTRINHKNERKHQEQLTNRKTISKIKWHINNKGQYQEQLQIQ